jgi:tRNA(adenine34) deaminase
MNYMQAALALARRAQSAGEVPVGAIVVSDGEVIGEGWNCPISNHDPSAHAEIMALRAAGLQRHSYRLNNAVLYVTLEPCAMCIGAIINARIRRVVFGAWDLKAGACGSALDLSREPSFNHRVDVFGGVCAEESTALLQRFFESRR